MASIESLESLQAAPSSPILERADSENASPGTVEMPAIYERKTEVETVLRSAFKRFVKRTKCAQCGVKCMEKRFASSSTLIVQSMIDVCIFYNVFCFLFLFLFCVYFLQTFWCDKCGRVLCEKHRNQHTCERQDFLDAKRRSMTPDQVRKRAF